MTVGASLRRGSIVTGRGRRQRSPVIIPARLLPVARTVALAAALTGVVEVALFRVAAPVLSHLPAGSGNSGLSEAVHSSGISALRATALLAPLSVLALAAAAWRTRRTESTLLLGAVAATLAAVAVPALGFALVAHVLTIAVVVYLVAAAARSTPGPHAVGVGLLAAAFVAGRWPLLVDALSGTGLTVAAGTVTTAQTIAEAALVAAPVAFATGVVRSGVSTRWAWKSAAAAGAALALPLTFAPEYLAITTLWASGVTLSLPPIGYIVAAACLGLVLAEWLANAWSRPWVAGIVLVAVAGVTPAVVHHNLSAVAGLVLLSIVTATGPVRSVSMARIGDAHG